MAVSDSLSQLAKKSTRFKVTLLLGVLLVSGFVYYQFRYSSMSEEEGTLENKKRSLSAQQRQLDKDLATLRELTAKNKELQQTIEDNQKALPTAPELPAFLDHLQRKAGDAGVTITEWENLKDEVVDIFIRVPVRVEVRGSFYQLMQYFYLLGPQPKDTLERDENGEEKKERIRERIVAIENLEISDATFEEGELKLKAVFVAATFRQNVPESQALPGQPTPPGRPSPAGRAAAGTAGNRGTAQNRRRRKYGSRSLHDMRARSQATWTSRYGRSRIRSAEASIGGGR